MNITRVRIKLAAPATQDLGKRLLAFASVTFDGVFVIHDLKIIDGAAGLFVAMPNHKRTVRCRACGFRNRTMARYCGGCATPVEVSSRDLEDPYTDVCHPVSNVFRQQLTHLVLSAYHHVKEEGHEHGEDWT